MKRVCHKTAPSSAYDKEAESYDAFNEKHSMTINRTLERLLTQHGVKTVLDLTCGTGSQVFWLAHRGFTLTGSDINQKMLKVAREKSKNDKLKIPFIKADMRTAQIGEFDAVITIFNSIGHLTKEDFQKTLLNIGKNLKKDGLYIFDIANLSYFLKDNNITDLTVDWLTTTNNTQFRDIQYAMISTEGVLALYTISMVQKTGEDPTISKSVKTLQIYSAGELKELLAKANFKIIDQCDIDGSPLFQDRTDRILTIAQKL